MTTRGANSVPRWWPALLVLLCAGAVVAAVLLVGPSSSPAAQQRLVTVERGVVQSTVSGSGTIEATQTNVNFSTGGRLVDVYVKAGQHVVEGQRLAAIDDTSARQALAEAEANLASANAKLEQAQAEQVSSASAAAKSRNPQQGAGSQTGGVTAASKAADVASAQAGVDSAQASVDSAQTALADTTLVAPVSGTVASVSNGVGDQASGGGSGSSQPSASSSSSSATGGADGATGSGASGSFIVIVNMGSLSLQVPFSESDIHKIRRGQPATVTVNALPGLELAAHVRSIDTLPTSNSGVVSYNVDFALDQRSSSLRPGMSASAEVVVSRVGDAVNVPSGAVSGRGPAASVSLVQHGKTTRQTVVTGLVGDSTTQVISGLKAGEQVAIPIATGIGSSGLSSGRTGAGGGGFGGGGGGGVFFGGGGGGIRRAIGGPGG